MDFVLRPLELLFQLVFGQLDRHRPAVGAIFYRSAHDHLDHLFQLSGAVFLSALDGCLAGHGVHQLIPGGGGIRCAVHLETLGQLQQGVLDIPRV